VEKKDLVLEGNMREVVGWVCPENQEPRTNHECCEF
jgi:hypothetical protein